METIKDWDEFYFLHVYLVARKSKDNSTKIGSVLVRDKILLSEGFNGICRGVNDDIEERHKKPDKMLYFEHSERNCLYNAARNGIRTLNSILYTNSPPCMECARGILQCGVDTVIYHTQHKDAFYKIHGDYWAENCKKSEKMLKEGGVKIHGFDKILGVECLINGQIVKV